MPTNLERFKSDLSNLVDMGKEMGFDITARCIGKNERDPKILEAAKRLNGCFEDRYQRWYTEASALLKQLLPDRLKEFNELYHGDGKRKRIIGTTYNIQDWLKGSRSHEVGGKKHFDDIGTIALLYQTQLEILKSVRSRFKSSLFDLAQLVRADLFDSELDAARELTAKGFYRAAGAVAGVVLEKHLAQVADNHNVSIRKKDPSIGDLNDALKNAGVLDIPLWRQIQRFADIRNCCDHGKGKEPTKDDVVELVNGVDKLCKTLY
jgi:hypothetical protein